MDLLKIKKSVEDVREWALKTENTKNGLDYRRLFKVITGEEPEGDNWEDRKKNVEYNKAAYAYGVYTYKGLNNWEEYKKRKNADKEFLSIISENQQTTLQFGTLNTTLKTSPPPNN